MKLSNEKEINDMKNKPFYSEGINSLKNTNLILEDGKAALFNYEEVDLIALIDQVYEKLASIYGKESEYAELFDVDKSKIDALKDRNMLSDSLKHGNQQSSIVKCMDNAHLLDDCE